jgi:hypothetical protein
MHRERAEQQSGAAAACGDMPQPHGAEDAAFLQRDEREPVGRLAALAQAAGRFAVALGAIGDVKQRLAGEGVDRTFGSDGQHGHSTFPVILRRERSEPRRMTARAVALRGARKHARTSG